MKRLIITLAALVFAALAQAASVQPAGDQIDTLRGAVVTGTRVAMERDRIPAPVSVVGRERIAASDESSLLPSLMEMTKADYQRFCYDHEGGAFAGGGLMNNDSVLFEMTLTRRRISPVNPIRPSLDLEIMAARLVVELGL